MGNRMKDFPEQRHIIEKTDERREMKILRGLVLGIRITLLRASNFSFCN